jgi:galactose oxidase
MKSFRMFLWFVLSVVMAERAHAAGAHEVGTWQTLPYLMPVNPIHVGLLRNGKILVVGGSENDPASKRNRTAILDLGAGTVAVRETEWDLFCSGMSFFPDGRVLLTGGTNHYDPFYGAAYGIIYNPANNQFIEGPEMHEGRWYPTNTVLADGRTLVISGYVEDKQQISRTLEIFDPLGWSWTSRSMNFELPLYPRGHLLPNGNVFYSGPARLSRTYDPYQNKWFSGPNTNYAATRLYGSSVLLPLSPINGYDAHVLIMGGNKTATNTAERIDLSQPAPRWVWASPMKYSRVELNATLLPNGYVLVTGGSGKDNVASTARKAAEWFNPATNKWSTLAPEAYWRDYHSNALLLPDGRVLTLGGNPKRRTVERHMGIFSPPYLYTTDSAGKVVAAPRPAISAISATSLRYDAAFEVSTPNAGDIASVVLIRPGAVTHAFDMEQRMIELRFAILSGKLRVTSPPDSAIAPYGYYMLFLVNKKGVPSVARWVRLLP